VNDTKIKSVKKILILAVNPRTTSRLRLDQEVREIEEGLRRSIHRDQFVIRSKLAVRIRDLQRELLDYEPHIVHFAGHGQKEGLIVEDESGLSKLLSSKALAELFKLCSNHVECVVLNACYSASHANAINKHINYVIGMRKEIKEKATIEFSMGFYDALGAGKSIEEAFQFGRASILASLPDLPEYLIPVLRKKKNYNKKKAKEITEPEVIHKKPGACEDKEHKRAAAQSLHSNLFLLKNYCELSYDEAVELKKHLSLLIVTATNIETQTLHQQMKSFPDCDELIKVPHKNQTYYLGIFGLYGAAHVQCEMGSISRGGSINTISEAIDVWQPKAVLMCGIAFGIDKKSQNIGDVLVSDGIIPYNIQRVGKEETIHRNPIPRAGALLFNRFKNAIDWNYTLPRNKKAKIIPGYILSGESLIDSTEYRDSLREAFPNAKGGEMEGAGLYSAADNKSLQWIVVKGICDFADGHKSKNKSQNQKIAAQSAIFLCLKVLSTPTGFKELGFVPITEWRGWDESNIKKQDKVNREEEKSMEAEEDNQKPVNSQKDSTIAKQTVNIMNVGTFINKF
jgi:nucleoside phosphorylase